MKVKMESEKVDLKLNIQKMRIIASSPITSIHFSSVTQLCLTFCDPMDCSTPGFPVHHQLPEFTQTHVHWVSDAIQPSHPLSSPFPPAFNVSQHQGLFKWVSSRHQVAKVLEFQLQHQSFQWRLSRVFSNTTVQKHQFFGAQPSSQSNSHIHSWPLEKPYIALTRQTLVGKVISLLLNMLSMLVFSSKE